MKSKGLKFLFLIILAVIIASPLSSLAQADPSGPTYNKSQAEEQQQAIARFVDQFTCSFESVTACFAIFFYSVLFVPTSAILAMVGKLFDLLLFFTIDSSSYSGVYASFINEGWRILRDLVNIAFILVLLSLAIKIILDLKAAEAKKMIGTVVIIALLINFSLFFVRVIVDSGNVLAHVFYNAITATADTNYLGSKSISASLVNAYNPSRIFLAFHDENNQAALTIKGQDPSAPPTQFLQKGTDVNQYAGYFILFSLLATALNVVTIWVFLVVCLLFLARTVGLWIVMLFAPIAFISYIVPKVEGFKTGFGHHDWWMDLLKYTLLAPIFVFFLYLIVMFLNLGAVKDVLGAENASTLQKILAIMFPFFVVMAILLRAKKTASELAGSLGETIMGAAQKVAGVAGGVALTGLSALGVGLLGRGAAVGLGGRGAAGAAAGEEAGAAAALLRARQSVGGGGGEVTPPQFGPGPTSPGGGGGGEQPIETPVPEREQTTPEREASKTRLIEITERKEALDKEHEELDKQPKVGFGAGQRQTRQTEIVEERKKLDEEKRKIETQLKPTATPKPATGREKTIKDYAAERTVGGWFARRAVKLLDKAQKGSWDGRNTWLVKQIEKAFGVSFGKAKNKGGFEAAQQARVAKELEFAKFLQPSGMELKELHRIGVTLNEMKLQQGQINEKDLFEHDNKGKIKKDTNGNRIAKSTADPNLLNIYNNLDGQIQTWQTKFDTEQKQTNEIKAERLRNYADVAKSGLGENFVINVATLGAFGSAQGLEAAYKIKEQAIKAQSTGKAFETDFAKQLLDKIKGIEDEMKKPKT